MSVSEKIGAGDYDPPRSSPVNLKLLVGEKPVFRLSVLCKSFVIEKIGNFWRHSTRSAPGQKARHKRTPPNPQNLSKLFPVRPGHARLLP